MAKKYKRLTNKQKQFNKKIRQQLISEGVIPPPKKRLNRKKYIEEAQQEVNESDVMFYDQCLYEAISIMLGHTDRQFKVSLEAIGVAKVLKLTVRLKAFYKKLENEGEKTYSLGEKVEYIKDILNA